MDNCLSKNNEIEKSIQLSTNRDRNNCRIIPLNIGKELQPIYNVGFPTGKYCDVVKEASAINQGAVSMYTTPTDRDFYLNSCYLSSIKDVTSTSLNASITTTINGVVVSLLRMAQMTLTAQSGTMTINFSIPVKIDRGVAINMGNSTAVANVSTWAGITGFTYQNDITSLNTSTNP